MRFTCSFETINVDPGHGLKHFKGAEGMTRFRKLLEATFASALWLFALLGVSLGQEKPDAKLSPAVLESQIQSLGSQFDSLKSEFGKRLERIEALIIGGPKGGDEAKDGILSDSKPIERSESCCKRVDCRYAERCEPCCGHERCEPCWRRERCEPCCRHYEPCCRHVEHHERCCRRVHERRVIRYERYVRYEPCCGRYHRAEGYDEDP